MKHDFLRTFRVHCTAALLLLYLTLPAISVTIFSAFVCSEKLGVDSDRYLLADFAVSCDDDEYSQFLVPCAVIALIAYPIGVPLLYIWLLWYFRDAIHHEKDENADNKVTTAVAFLHEPFSHQCYWWEAVDTMRRVLLVGVPVFFERSDIRVVVASMISMLFLAIHEKKTPYRQKEHNFLAGLGCTQVTVTLMIISLSAAGFPVSGMVGFLCIVLNVLSVPLTIWFNTRRLLRRKRILAAFLLEHENETNKKGDNETQFFDPHDFVEAWRAGRRSEHELFDAALSWIDSALTRPVSHDRWDKILFLVEQLPMLDLTHGDARFGESHRQVTCGMFLFAWHNGVMLAQWWFIHRGGVRHTRRTKRDDRTFSRTARSEGERALLRSRTLR